MGLVEVQAANPEPVSTSCGALFYHRCARHDWPHLRSDEDRVPGLPKRSSKDPLAPALTEPFPSWLCPADLQYVDGLGELTGAPGAAAELVCGEFSTLLSWAFARLPGERSLAWVAVAGEQWGQLG